MKISVSNSSRNPIYEQISKQIRSQIISGELNAGEALPSIRNLAKELQVSVITTKKAYEILEQEGYLDKATGRGTFVAEKNEELLNEIRMKIIEDRIGEAVSEAKSFGISRKELIKMLNFFFSNDS